MSVVDWGWGVSVLVLDGGLWVPYQHPVDGRCYKGVIGVGLDQRGKRSVWTVKEME